MKPKRRKIKQPDPILQDLKQYVKDHNAQEICTCTTDPSNCFYHGEQIEEFEKPIPQYNSEKEKP